MFKLLKSINVISICALICATNSQAEPIQLAPITRTATSATAAGVLSFYRDQKNDAYVLLGKRAGLDVAAHDGTWCNLGGKSDEKNLLGIGDDTLAETAAREVQEESSELIQYTTEQLDRSYSHDLVPTTNDSALQQDPERNKFLYRTYIAESAYIEPAKLLTKSPEYSEFRWVPVGELILAAKGTIQNIALYPPFLDTLRQGPVLSVLEAIRDNKPYKKTHTQGVNGSWDATKRTPDLHKLEVRWNSNPTMSWREHQSRTRAHTLKQADFKIRDEKEEKTQQTTPSPETRLRVDFGFDAAGNRSRTRKLQIPTEESRTEIINLDPKFEEAQFARAVASHGAVMAELRTAPFTRAFVAHGNVVAQIKKKATAGTLRVAAPVAVSVPPAPTSPTQELRERLRKAPYTQTEAFLKTELGDRYQEIRTRKIDGAAVSKKNIQQQVRANIELFLSDQKLAEVQCSTLTKLKTENRKEYDQYVDVLTEALMTEREHPDKFVFYHGTGAEVGFLMDFYSEVRNQLSIQGPKKFYLRAIDTAFSDFPDFKTFITYFSKDGAIDNYNGNYQDMGLSTNPFLFGNPRNKGSCTTDLFFDGTNDRSLDLERFYNNISVRLGFTGSYQQFHKMFEKYRAPNLVRHGRLVQVFIDPSKIDETAYLAHAMGPQIKLPENSEKQSSVVQALSSVRFQPESLEKLLATEIEENGITKTTPAFVQARVFMHPDQLYSDENLIKDYSRSRSESDSERKSEGDFRKKMTQFVRDQIASNLRKYQKIDRKHLHQDLKVKTLHHRAFQEITGKDPDLTKEKLPFATLINEDDLDGVLSFLRENPDFDFGAEIHDTAHIPGQIVKHQDLFGFLLRKRKYEVLDTVLEYLERDPNRDEIKSAERWRLFFRKLIGGKFSREAQLRYFDRMTRGLSSHEKNILRKAIDGRATDSSTLFHSVLSDNDLSFDLIIPQTTLTVPERIQTIPVLLKLLESLSILDAKVMHSGEGVLLGILQMRLLHPDSWQLFRTSVDSVDRLSSEEFTRLINPKTTDWTQALEDQKMGYQVKIAIEFSARAGKPDNLDTLFRLYTKVGKLPLQFDKDGESILYSAALAGLNDSEGVLASAPYDLKESLANRMVAAFDSKTIPSPDTVHNCLYSSSEKRLPLLEAVSARYGMKLLDGIAYRKVKKIIRNKLLESSDPEFIVRNLAFFKEDFSEQELALIRDTVRQAQSESQSSQILFAAARRMTDLNLVSKILKLYSREQILRRGDEFGRNIFHNLAEFDPRDRFAVDRVDTMIKLLNTVESQQLPFLRPYVDTKEASPLTLAFRHSVKHENHEILKIFADRYEKEKCLGLVDGANLLMELFKTDVPIPVSAISDTSLNLILKTIEKAQPQGVTLGMYVPSTLKGLFNSENPPLFDVVRKGHFASLPFWIHFALQNGGAGLIDNNESSILDAFAEGIKNVIQREESSVEKKQEKLREALQSLNDIILIFDGRPTVKECQPIVLPTEGTNHASVAQFFQTLQESVKASDILGQENTDTSIALLKKYLSEAQQLFDRRMADKFK